MHLSNKFLLDKILHDYELTDKVLEVTKPKVIFLLREPENTLKSIINMGYLTGIEWYKNPEKALKYYNNRLSQLEKLSKQVAGDYCFIESDDLVNTPEAILEKLTHWLNLKQPLKKEYSIFKNTGKPGYGDPSENIKSGVLEQTRRYPKIIIPPEILQQGKVSYSKCKEELLKGRIS